MLVNLYAMCLPVTYNNKSVKMLPETVNVGIPPKNYSYFPKLCLCANVVVSLIQVVPLLISMISS